MITTLPTSAASAKGSPFVPPVGAAGSKPLGGDGVVTNRRKFLHAQSAVSLADQERRSAEAAAALVAPASSSPLIAHLRSLLDASKRAREDSGVDRMLKEALLAMNSEYAPEKLQKILQQGSSDIYIQLTETKFNHYTAWMSEFAESTGGFGFDLSPTPIPDLSSKLRKEAEQHATRGARQDFFNGHPWPSPEELEEHTKQLEENLRESYEQELSEKALAAAEAMKTEMGDQLTDCEFNEVYSTFLEHVGGLGTGFLKGPVIRWKESLKWGDDPSNPEIVRKPIVTVEAPNPMDIYPIAGAKNLQDGLYERTWFSKETLLSYKGLKHYQDRAIDDLVTMYPNGKTDLIADTDSVRSQQELQTDRSHNDGCRYEGWIYWGPILGEKLIEWGVKGVEKLKTYPMEIMFANNWPIKIMMNPNPLGVVPYFPAVLKKRIGSVWGKPMYHLMKDAQDVANGEWRAIIDNSAMGARPMIAVDYSTVNAEDVGVPYGGKVFRVNGEKNLNKTDPVKGITVDIKAHELLTIAKEGERMADNETGIPAHTYGGQASGGFDKTASGYMMQLEAASRGLKHTVKSTDRAKSAFMRNLYQWNMLHNDKEEIKGDAQVEVKGTLKILFEAAQQERVKEFVAFIEKSPMGQKLIGLEGFNELVKKYADTIHLDSGELFPSEEELKAKMAEEKAALLQESMRMLQAGAAPGAGGPPAVQNGFAPPMAAA